MVKITDEEKSVYLIFCGWKSVIASFRNDNYIGGVRYWNLEEAFDVKFLPWLTIEKAFRKQKSWDNGTSIK
jgi:hypothetical protein